MNNRSIITSNYEGWIVSIILHGLLSLIFLLIIYDNPIDISEYTDLTFSNYSPIDLPVIEENVLSPAPPSPVVSSAPRTSQPIAKSITPTRKVDLPTRRMTEHDFNRIPLESQGQLTKSGLEDRINTKRETIYDVNENLSSLDEDIFNTLKPGSKPSDKSVGEKIDAIAVPGQKGSDVKFDKPYEISWEGVKREILNDPRPEYPEGINIEGKIRIKIIVSPDGTIGELILLQKLDATLESETLKNMKFWRFSPLKPTDPQMNQTAVITFRFVLQ
jgi:TonB family protein